MSGLAYLWDFCTLDRPVWNILAMPACSVAHRMKHGSITDRETDLTVPEHMLLQRNTIVHGGDVLWGIARDTMEAGRS